jgi:hypothetical protein
MFYLNGIPVHIMQLDIQRRLRFMITPVSDHVLLNVVCWVNITDVIYLRYPFNAEQLYKDVAQWAL